MVVNKIDKLISQAAQTSNYPKEVVESVVFHNFKTIKDYILNPDSPGFRYHYFGVIRPVKKPLRHHLKTLIKRMRNSDDPDLRDKFRKLWNLRHYVNEDDKRRNYKSRFGNWHYK